MEPSRDKTIKIAVISDLHVMAPELLKKDSSASHEAVINDHTAIIDL